MPSLVVVVAVAIPFEIRLCTTACAVGATTLTRRVQALAFRAVCVCVHVVVFMKLNPHITPVLCHELEPGFRCNILELPT